MPNTLKKIGEDEFRFDCECGRIHLISSDGAEGKIKVETIYKPPTQKGKAADDNQAGKTDSGSSATAGAAAVVTKRKSVFGDLL